MTLHKIMLKLCSKRRFRSWFYFCRQMTGCRYTDRFSITPIYFAQWRHFAANLELLNTRFVRQQLEHKGCPGRTVVPTHRNSDCHNFRCRSIQVENFASQLTGRTWIEGVRFVMRLHQLLCY